MELNRQETDKWNAEIEKIVGIGLTMLQRAELSNYFKSEVKKLTIPVVSKLVNCEHTGDETLHQGDGFIYKTCADCGEDI